MILTPLPLYHIFSLTANCLVFMSIGGENVLITNPRDIAGLRQGDAPLPVHGDDRRQHAVQRAAEPSESSRSVDFSALRLALGGGMAVQEAVARRWKEVTGVPLVEAYGLTETSPAATINPLDLAPNTTARSACRSRRPTSCCATTRATTCRSGEPGEICIRGPQVMAGYWQRPDETAKAMTPTAIS